MNTDTLAPPQETQTTLPGFEDYETDSAAADTGSPEPAPASVDLATDEEPASVEASVSEEPATVRIMIVDDETAMCAMTSAIVQSMGYVPICAHSGEEAIETFRGHQDRDEVIQAIVMDLALPGGMSGLEATDVLREIDGEVKVIASSGYLQQNARSTAIERGFSGILPKPYTAERLTAELRWVVNHR